MWKIGLLRPEEVPSEGIKDMNWVSYRLLRMPPEPSAEDLRIFEAVIVHVQLSNGIFRTTFPGRFREVDSWVDECLEKYFSPDFPLQAEDWAASDCLTSLEWLESLSRRFPDARMAASDLTLFLLEYTSRSGWFVVESDGTPLQYIRPPLVVSLKHSEPLRYPVNRWVRRRALTQWKSIMAGIDWNDPWLSGSGPEEELWQEREANGIRKIPLVHPRAVVRARDCAGRLAVRRHGVFSPAPSPCDVLRTMNIFNRNYFPEHQLAKGAAAVHASLRPGGIWIVGRTVRQVPAQHQVSIYRKAGDWFENIGRLNGGSEMEGVVETRTAGAGRC
jgi:hypothetical protein